jgi:UvrD-like helicase C-terminal domain
VPRPAGADRVLSTAHRAKVLEWERVRLADDFPDLRELGATGREGVPLLAPEGRDQELHLLYVAATRARRGLEPDRAVRGCLRAAGTVPVSEAAARRGWAA